MLGSARRTATEEAGGLDIRVIVMKAKHAGILSERFRSRLHLTSSTRQLGYGVVPAWAGAEQFSAVDAVIHVLTDCLPRTG